jgi:UDP-N-acetylglucosamine/UDP-N-acetylgalactosamine diphosphorylase
MLDLVSAQSRLAAAGQSHVLRFFDRLTKDQQHSLLAQVETLDLAALPSLIDSYVKNKPAASLPPDIAPAPFYRYADGPKFRAAGEALLRAGKVGAFVVAGGQGSRLGYEGPKGCYPATPVSGKPLFQVFAEQLLAARRKYGAVVPWYVMTSPLNHAATETFFRRHEFFDLGSENVMFFRQGVMPSLDISTGRMLMAAPGEIATNPDGHGGAIRALMVSGAIADMQRRGIEHLSYFQVDNPHVQICDPAFLGVHASAPDSSAEMSSKMVAKIGPDEKVGVFCRVNGKLDVIEYSDMPKALSEARNPDGSLKFIAGSIAIHILSRTFIEKLNNNASFSLPYHRAEKKVACIDIETGAPINPSSNNAVKLERFVFDALPLAKSSIVFETDRVEEFAPIKNATGADSVESSKSLQSLRAARWLTAAGANVPAKPDGTPDCVIELSPLAALDAEDLRPIAPGLRIERGSKVVL